MATVKEEIRALLDKLPDDCTYEDVQFHLYVVEKVNRGIKRAEEEGAVSQEDAERKFSRWTAK